MLISSPLLERSSFTLEARTIEVARPSIPGANTRQAFLILGARVSDCLAEVIQCRCRGLLDDLHQLFAGCDPA